MRELLLARLSLPLMPMQSNPGCGGPQPRTRETMPQRPDPGKASSSRRFGDADGPGEPAGRLWRDDLPARRISARLRQDGAPWRTRQHGRRTGVERNLFKYILRHSRHDQVIILIIVVLAQVFYFLSLDIPKTIVNTAIQ